MKHLIIINVVNNEGEPYPVTLDSFEKTCKLPYPGDKVCNSIKCEKATNYFKNLG